MTYIKKERERYNLYRDRVCQNLGVSKYQFNEFRRWGNRLHAIYELQCNGFSCEEAEKRAEHNEELYYKLAREKAEKLGLFVFFQTDPRGATIYLDTKEIPENNYTQANCVY